MELKKTGNPNSQHYLFKNIDPQTNLTQIRNTRIFKFMSLDHVISMIQNKVLWINKVNTWDDVYENILFKQNFFCDSGNRVIPVNVSSVSDRIFGQCWTSHPESDAMWRIYSPDKTNYAVRISTTIGKLMDVVDHKNASPTFVGEVSYVDDAYITKTLSQYVNNGLDFGCSMTKVAELLLLKRKEFEHEKEIRLIISKGSDYHLDHIEYSIDPQLFIDEITLDSRIAPNSPMFRNYKSKLLATGILNKKINRSILYDLPSPVNIKLI